MGLSSSIKRSFWRGLAALLPALLTVVVLVFGLSFVHTYAGQYVNRMITQVAAWVSGIPLVDVEVWYDRYWLTWLGAVLAVILLCLVAYVVGTFIGARLIRVLERWIQHVPILKQIYPGAKQVSEFLFSDRPVEFRRVVAIQFPRPGMWMVGFVTGRALKGVSAHAGSELLSVFVPFTPAPVTGYIVMVSKDEVVDLDLSVEEALQYLISAGVIMPPTERMGLPPGTPSVPPKQPPAAPGARNP